MHCSSCGTDNPDGVKFCEQCGAPFKRRCAKCGFEKNSPAARYCAECGAAINAAHAPAAPDPAAFEHHETTDGERRQLTVVFCDLVGSTPLSQQLDAEEWRDIIAQYQQAASGVVARFGGYVAKNLGDGLLIYFGWPTAREDDPERAVRAGLAIVEAIHSTPCSPPLTGRVWRSGLASTPGRW
jgi:class 3 adenylate cyclase